MSQLQFQTALAMLIRLPEHNRIDVEEFLKHYQLEEIEKTNLRHLANHREVNKFGFKLRGFRIEFFMHALPITLEHIDQEKLIDFIRWEFDPYFTSIEARSVYRHFRKFFMQYKERSHEEVLKKYFGDFPDYLFDLIQFELLESELEYQGFVHNEKPKTGSLVHHKFETLSLDFGIQEYVEKKRRLTPKKSAFLTPKTIRTHLLFLCDDESRYGYQVFEIDEIGVNFLEQSRLGQIAPKPSYYADFIETGLCR